MKNPAREQLVINIDALSPMRRKRILEATEHQVEQERISISEVIADYSGDSVACRNMRRWLKGAEAALKAVRDASTELMRNWEEICAGEDKKT